ncbi:LysM peptidoglycan-binding domain-containing protein [Alkalibacillus almallahensis]|uniref:LysM peptidoglycan-binding domain-containing protein n=1 Tax=Alkalibacillus almallahensis TaxID=1379154 RepID=UPI001421ED68|nr:LysM peptidoglycan-binding domain-containing protein [Alkalibacillus almallahensis]NIK11252.1 LysM repeat protein [Alkalibacillus almallahensis]
MKFHIVKQGETMASIAEQYGLSESNLYDMNKHLSDVTEVLEGMKVKVPQQAVANRQEVKQKQTSSSHSNERFPFPDHAKPRSIPVIREDEWFDKKLAPYIQNQGNSNYNNGSYQHYGTNQPVSLPFPYPHFYRENPYGYGWSNGYGWNNGCGCQ